MTPRRPRARLTRPRPHARGPEVCPLVVIGLTRRSHVALIPRRFPLTTTPPGWVGPTSALTNRQLTIQRT